MASLRYLCSQLMTLSWPDGETIANLEEIQAGCGVVESDTEVAPGTHVGIRSGDICFTGTVTKVEAHTFGWRITVEFSDLTPWAIENFRPEHFFDPAAMVRAAGGSETT